MPRFVILEHDHPTLHWDLMLEASDTLKTWRLPAPPTENPREAEALGDHRAAYLDYEGPVSGNRGTVKRWDAGTFAWIGHTGDVCRVVLQGTRWSGTATLRRNAAAWSVSFEPGSLEG